LPSRRFVSTLMRMHRPATLANLTAGRTRPGRSSSRRHHSRTIGLNSWSASIRRGPIFFRFFPRPSKPLIPFIHRTYPHYSTQPLLAGPPAPPRRGRRPPPPPNRPRRPGRPRLTPPLRPPPPLRSPRSPSRHAALLPSPVAPW